MASALFDIENDGEDRGYDATSSTTLHLRLRSADGVSGVQFQIWDPTRFDPSLSPEANPPFKSKGAPLVDLDNGVATGKTLSPVGLTGEITLHLEEDASFAAWILRCIVNGGKTQIGGRVVDDPSLVHERMIVVRDQFNQRPIIATETLQYESPDGWAGAFVPGLEGLDGATGPTGPSGATGPTGGTGATGTSGAADFRVFELTEDFVGGTDVSGSASSGTHIGIYQTASGTWHVSGHGSVTENVGSPDHPGVAALISTDASQGIHLHLGQSLLGGGTVCRFDELEEFTVSVAVQGPAPSNVQFGLRNDTGPHFIRMQSTPLTATWDCQCMTSGTPTDVTAGTVPSSLFSTYSIKQPTVGTIEFSQGGSLIATINTNVPSSAFCNLSFDIYNAAGYGLYVDKLYFKTKPLAR